jgi:hypothetical protein
MKPSKWKFAATLYLAGMLLIHAFVFWNARALIWKGYPDFTIYYCAGTIVRQGLGHHLYDEATQFIVQKGFAPDVAIRVGALPYNHPPFEALYFAPLTYFSYGGAFLLWDLANLAMLGVLPFLLRPHLACLQNCSWRFWMLASLAFFPIFFTLLQGQDSILLLLLYTLAFACLKKNKNVHAGCWLALGLFKFHLVLPFVLLLLIQGRKRMLYGFLLTATALALISVAIVGWDGIASYPHYVLQLEDTMARGAIMPSDMPNLRGLLYLILGDAPHAKAVVVVISGVTFLFAAWLSRVNGNVGLRDLMFSLAAVITVLVSYHCLGYDLSLLMLPVLLLANELLGEDRPRGWPAGLMICAAAVLFFSPVHLFLLMRANRLALVGGAVLLGMFGIAGQILKRNREGYPVLNRI